MRVALSIDYTLNLDVDPATVLARLREQGLDLSAIDAVLRDLAVEAIAKDPPPFRVNRFDFGELYEEIKDLTKRTP